MANYDQIQFIGYGTVTSVTTQVLPATSVNDWNADLESRATTLCDVADWIRTTLGAKLGGADVLKVLLVPEFYFRYGGPSDPHESLNDSYPNAQSRITNMVESILRPRFGIVEYQDWLIVAGTVFWYEPPTPKRDHPLYFNTVLALHGGTDTALSPAEQDANDLTCQVPTMSYLSTNQKALMSHIDWAPDVDRRPWDAAINPMFAEIMGSWPWWRWHVFKVHGVHGPTGAPLVFGLEVCLEHYKVSNEGTLGALRILQQSWQSRCGGNTPLPPIDVQLVTSCGMSLQPARGVAGQPGGIAAICDGHLDSAHVWWPNLMCTKVTDVTSDGVHNLSLVGLPVDSRVLPANLQIGIPTARHNPPDAVTVWSAVGLQGPSGS